jgi:hypothetical protein
MKAQKLRRTFWLASLLLGAGVAGVAALIVLTKPAEAKDAVTSARQAMANYTKLQPRKILEAPVKEEDLKREILRPDWKPLPYYPYAGPRIPAPKAPEVVETRKEEGPKDLAATGRVATLIYDPPNDGQQVAVDTVLFWEFTDKKKLAFVPGEYIKASKTAPDRFLLVDVEREAPGVSRFRILYDVVEVPGDASKNRRAELIYDAEPKITDADEKIMPGSRKLAAPPAPPTPPADGTTPAPAGAAPATTGVTPAAPVEPAPAATASDPDDWKPTIKTVSSGRRDIEFDENTFKKWKGKKIEDVLENVRTENYDKGGVQGVQIFPLDGNDMAAKFDIRRHDILISINGQGVKSKDDAIRVARTIPPDTDRVTVVIDRDGRQITYNVDPRDPKNRRAAASLVR